MGAKRGVAGLFSKKNKKGEQKNSKNIGNKRTE
jgi:hypothetical protein